MAVIAQKDIDELLNNITSNNNSDESFENNKFIVEEKTFKEQKKPISKINMLYKSPVIKSGSIIFNPESDTCSSEKKVVVRSLNNYMKYISKNNKSKIKYLSEDHQF